MIFVVTGNGKGKTTSAIGQGIRVVGQGGKVTMVQFIKSKKFPTGEEKALLRFKKDFQLVKGGKGFVGILGDRLPLSEHKKAAQKTLSRAKTYARSGKFQLLILDEVNVALSLNLLSQKDVLSFLANVPEGTDVMCTGRGAPLALIKKADLVTECREIKHPFSKGVIGKRAREY
jgi:cob(I)alamin adenosyltransferase